MSLQPGRTVTVSVVSHLQGVLAREFLVDLATHCVSRVEVLLTVNIPERLPFSERDFPMPVRIICNSGPKGFGANHNAAFRQAQGQAFCIVNPDIRLHQDPFPALLEALRSERVGVAAPLVENPVGCRENSARRFPTVRSLLGKALGAVPALDYPVGEPPFSPDWVGGMFMLLRSETFAAVGGFDERYYLYYEDVDLCRRLRRAGLDVRFIPAARVVHSAQRASRRSLRHVRWHLSSMCRFLTSG